MRDKAEQNALYAQGRESLRHVNELRLRAKLPPLKPAENLKPVTNAKSGGSYHNLPAMLIRDGDSRMTRAYGYAVDIVDRKKGWDIGEPGFGSDLGSLAKKYGCEWGGDWKKPDLAHVQMTLIDSGPSNTAVV